MILRDYQSAAREAVRKEWETVGSTLLVMATGTGKTRTAAAVVEMIQPLRTMFLVHRRELAWQAQKQLKQAIGIESEIEMGGQEANRDLFHESPVVISSFQTQYSGKGDWTRMKRFDPNRFGLLIVDESHHGVSPSFKKVIDYYRTNPNLRVLGLTATPDRADEQALGQLFETVAYEYEILDAIQDGWLVDVKPVEVSVEGLDLSHIDTVAGDLNQGQLAAIMEAEGPVMGVVQPTLEAMYDLPLKTLAAIKVEAWGDHLRSLNRRPKQTLVFTVSVRQAELLAGIFNRVTPGLFDWVCDKTPEDKRAEMLARFHRSEIAGMVNVGILSEGYDSPSIEIIVQARPTKSRCLSAQQIGRGTRPLTGVTDGIESPEARRSAIADSAKPVLKVLDFVGNCGKHKLVTPADVLGGKEPDDVVDRAKKKIAEQNGDVRGLSEVIRKAAEEIEQERQDRERAEAAKKARVVARVQFTSRAVNAFDVFGIMPQRERGWDTDKQLSSKQKAVLLKQGIDPSIPYHQGRQLLNEIFRRWDHKQCSFRQAKILRARGYSTKLSVTEANAIIDIIAQREGWKARIE